MAGCLEFAGQRLFPGVAGVYGHPNYTGKIAGNFDLSALECAHLVAPEMAHKIAQLEQNILSCWRFRFAAFDRDPSSSGVKSTTATVLACLLVQDHRLEANFLEETGDGLRAQSFSISVPPSGR